MKLWAALVGVIVVLVCAIVISSEGDFIARLSVFVQPPDGPPIVMQVEPDGMEVDQAVEQSIKVIERRLDGLGAARSVRQEGPSRIVIRLRRSEDASRA